MGLVICAWADTGFYSTIRVTETDNSPACTVGQLKVSPGTLTCTGQSATVTTGGSSGGAGYFVEPATVTFLLNLGATVSTLTVTGVQTSTLSFVVKDGSGNPILWTDTTPPAVSSPSWVVAGSTSNGFIAGFSTSTAGPWYVDISTTGHLNGQAMASVPVPSSCGSSPSMFAGSTDFHGTIQVGGGVVTSCVLTFANAYKGNPPDCVVSDNGAAISSAVTAKSVSSITIGTSATLGGGTITYLCIGSD